jgi:molybdopterin converting factor small subunit
MITIELFGVPRLRAGLPLVRLEAVDVGSALRGLASICPRLDGSVLLDGQVHPAYKLSLNGDRFVTEPETRLSEGDVLLLLAADVGG